VREHDDLLERFRHAAGSGDMDGLLALLSDHAVLRSDGGGKATALPNVLHGPDRIARAISRGFGKLLPKNLVRRIMQVNGQSSVVSYLDGRPHSVLTLDVGKERIRAVYIVTNPEKLAHLPPFPS
jgi:RNA polymerase sigma-70 factor (ECF subfamily)